MAYREATCYTCGATFTCNPALVPGVRVDSAYKPICRPCIEKYNQELTARGMKPIAIRVGAYPPEP